MTVQAFQPSAPAGEPVWADEPWTPLRPLVGEQRTEVCVVGLGGSGLSALNRLEELGIAAVGIDAASVGAGAAGRNGGFLLAGMAPFHHELVDRVGRDRATSLYRGTLDELTRILAETPEATRRTGSLRLAADEDERTDCRAQLEAMRADTLDVEPYAGTEGDGLLFPADGVVQPLRRCRLLARRLLAAGTALFERSPAVAIDGTRVHTPSGSIDAEGVVVAVDGGLELLLPALGARVRTARAQMLATAPDRVVSLPRPVYSRWGWDYWQQLADGRIALGGCRDVGGEAEWTTTAEPSAAVQAALEELLRRRVGTRAPVTHRWTGLIAFTEDRLPVLEQVGHGVWAVGAYSGTGNVVGSLCARAAVDRLAGVGSEWGDLLDGVTGR